MPDSTSGHTGTQSTKRPSVLTRNGFRFVASVETDAFSEQTG